MKALGLTAIFWVVSLMVASSVSAQGSHGLRDVGCCVTHGSRAKITSPSQVQLSITPGSFGLMAVWAVQTGQVQNETGIDAGFIDDTQAMDGDPACPANPLFNYVEQVLNGVFHCFFAGNDSYAHTLKYSVLRNPGDFGGWQGYVDGVAKGPVLSWFSEASELQAGGEVGNQVGHDIITGRYAFPDLEWQRTDATLNWQNITSATPILDTGWSLGGSFPTDWTVSHS
jgi:hypothetical protein